MYRKFSTRSAVLQFHEHRHVVFARNQLPGSPPLLVGSTIWAESIWRLIELDRVTDALHHHL
jgi:hypothetical protein